MKALAEIQILPVGKDVSVEEEVERANQILSSSGLRMEVHSMGTDIEGELEEVFGVLKRIHEQLHHRGVVRLSTVIKLGTRPEEERREEAHAGKATREHTDVPAGITTAGRDSFVTVWQIASPAK